MATSGNIDCPARARPAAAHVENNPRSASTAAAAARPCFAAAAGRNLITESLRLRGGKRSVAGQDGKRDVVVVVRAPRRRLLCALNDVLSVPFARPRPRSLGYHDRGICPARVARHTAEAAIAAHVPERRRDHVYARPVVAAFGQDEENIYLDTDAKNSFRKIINVRIKTTNI